MHKAAEAYSRTSKIVGSPREVEANLLIQAASNLEVLRKSWPEQKDKLDDVLLDNRRLWTVFVSSVANKENPLPHDIKNNVASLGAFIFFHTVVVQSDPTPEKLVPLININREIAAGLNSAA